MASRRRTQSTSATRRLKRPASARSAWPHVEELLDCDGHITVGRISPVPYAAVASDEYNMLAALVRRKGESLLDLLERLDQAIDHAMNDDIFTDEINS